MSDEQHLALTVTVTATSVNALPTRALLLINPKSRNGNASIDAIVEKLQQGGLTVIDGKPQHPQHIRDLIMQHARQIDCVIIGGGDGSMNAAAPALIRTGIPMALLPMGTANDLARTLQIPLEPEAAADVILDGTLHSIDLGCVNGHPFFNIANIGLGANVRQQMTPEIKKRWGIFSYPLCTLRALWQFRPFRAEILCDGRRRRLRSLQIAIGNGRHYGGGMTVADDAAIDDGMFHLYSIKPMRWWELLRMATVIRSGEFGWRDPVHLDKGQTIEVFTRRPMAVTADGEMVTNTPARFEILPQAVRVFVPASYLALQEQEQKQEWDNVA